jgi:hypothetical protein
MDAITLRFAERLLAVLFGGMAIYLGYRLFLKVPNRQDGDGKFSFPGDISIVLARVGPGVFFALFGAAVVGTSLFKGIEWQHGRQSPSAVVETTVQSNSPPARTVETVDFKGAGALLHVQDREARAAARRMLRREIAFLNDLTSYLRRDLSSQERSEIEFEIPRIKLALMKPVWGDRSEGWGDFGQFELWLRNAASDPPPLDLKDAVQLYRYGQRGKP